jgi:hypothetical protein
MLVGTKILLVRGVTQEIHEHWSPTNNDDSTVFYYDLTAEVKPSCFALFI